MTAGRISIIVPILNEAEGLHAFLGHLRERAPDSEIVVCDGGSRDPSPQIAEMLADRFVASPHGRARQMNAGAAAATGEVVWFVHADSRLPPEPFQAIREALAAEDVAGGCFRIRIPRTQPVYRVSDRLGNLGVDLFGIALGDHGIFCRRSVFDKIGGYPDVPLMEDAELYRKLRRCGRTRQLPLEIETSPRRYELNGPYRTTAIYGIILTLYCARVPIPVLQRIHRALR